MLWILSICFVAATAAASVLYFVPGCINGAGVGVVIIDSERSERIKVGENVDCDKKYSHKLLAPKCQTLWLKDSWVSRCI